MITLQNISKSFSDKPVLRNLDLSFESDVHYALTGPSGCGKTTLLRILAGFEKEDTGKIQMPDNCKISYAFQEPRLFEHITVLKNIEITGADRNPRTILAALGLSEAANAFPHELSGGMKKRAALARALAHSAALYLLDESTAGQDELHARMVSDAILYYTKKAVTLFASHDHSLITRCADKIIQLNNGKAVLIEK